MPLLHGELHVPPLVLVPRLHEIIRAVANSVRSHYDRRDLGHLFELQPRAAQKLLELLPSVQIGTSRLIEREVLASFLNRVRETEDTSLLFKQLRTEKQKPPTRTPAARFVRSCGETSSRPRLLPCQALPAPRYRP